MSRVKTGSRTMADSPAGYMTTAEAAGDLNVDPSTIRTWVRKGTLRGIKRGMQLFVYRNAITMLQPPEPPEEIIPIETVCRRLGVSRARVIALAREGRLSTWSCRGRVYIDGASLKAEMARREVPAGYMTPHQAARALGVSQECIRSYYIPGGLLEALEKGALGTSEHLAFVTEKSVAKMARRRPFTGLPPGYITLKEAVRGTGLSLHTIRNYCWDRKVKSEPFRVGRYRMTGIEASSLWAYVRSRPELERGEEMRRNK